MYVCLIDKYVQYEALVPDTRDGDVADALVLALQIGDLFRIEIAIVDYFGDALAHGEVCTGAM